MRILLVHNYYGSTAPSGENKVFEAEKAMLEKHGETVETYTRHSDEIRVVVSGWWLVVRVKKIFNLIKGALCTVGNPFAARALRKKIKAFKPDVVHFHNQFPLISPLAIRAAHKAGCKVVMTLHNYRLVCAGGIPMRDGKVCRDCFKPCRSGELENWRRRQAEKKVEEWLAGVSDKSFETALEKLVAEKCAAGEYRFKKPEERELALAGAKRFYREFSRKIVPLSDGRCVYFAPDARAKMRNGSNAVSWAEYAFHAVSNGGAKVAGKNYNERWFNPHKVATFKMMDAVLKQEHCFIRLSSAGHRYDAIVFAGDETTSAKLQIVTRLDEMGNIDANLSEVTFTASSKEKKPPRLVPLTEAVRTVVHYQTAAGSNPPNRSSIANRLEARKGVGCGGLSVMPAVRHRCYRGSLLATLPLAINIWLYRHCWAKWVDRFICLTPFAKDMMVSAGFPADKIAIKGNFIHSATATSNFSSPKRSGVVFAGRLSPEKGPQVLVEAWNMLGDDAPELTIIGDGDFRAEYESKAKSRKIRFVGQKSHEEVLAAVAAAKLVAIPSMCYEGLPTNLMEAFMLGTPCVVSNLGALPSLVDDGACGEVFEAGNAEALAAAIKRVLKRPDYEAVCERCRKCAAERYSEETNYRQLKIIYDNL